jgi:hypothetical protein
MSRDALHIVILAAALGIAVVVAYRAGKRPLQ